MTPEGKVKEKIKEVLTKYDVYYFMPVMFGYGPTGLDFHCVVPYRNVPIAFFIEAKAPDGVTSKRQDILIDKLKTKYKARVWVIDDEYTLKGLERWLIQMQQLSQATLSLSTHETQVLSTNSLAGSVTKT